MKSKNQNRGFTIIESVIVLFIIGVLTITASIGFGRANREKKVDRASRKVSSALNRMRDSSYLGQEINQKFPCGYAVSLAKDQKNFQVKYTNELDRIGLIDSDEICDEKIINKNVALAGIGEIYSPNDLELEVPISPDATTSTTISDIIDSKGNSINCLTILFSAPRQGSYYSSDCVNSPKFVSLTDSTDPKFFDVTFKTSDGMLEASKQIRLFPSGNTSTLVSP